MARKNNHPTMKRSVAARGKTVDEFVDHMGNLGVATNPEALANLRGRATKRSSADSPGMEVDEVGGKRARSATRERSETRRNSAQMARSRSPSAAGSRDEVQVQKVAKLAKQKQFKLSKFGKVGESDRRIPSKRPKHLNTGKRGSGKTDRR